VPSVAAQKGVVIAQRPSAATLTAISR